MKTKLKNQSGFTLMEIMLVVLIVGIMAAVAIPFMQNSSAEANRAARNGIIGAIEDGLAMYYGNALTTTGTGSYPANIAAFGTNFSNVLGKALVPADWTISGNTFYHNDSNASTSTAGTFTYLTQTVNGVANAAYTLTCAGAGCAGYPATPAP